MANVVANCRQERDTKMVNFEPTASAPDMAHESPVRQSAYSRFMPSLYKTPKPSPPKEVDAEMGEKRRVPFEMGMATRFSTGVTAPEQAAKPPRPPRPMRPWSGDVRMMLGR